MEYFNAIFTKTLNLFCGGEEIKYISAKSIILANQGVMMAFASI